MKRPNLLTLLSFSTMALSALACDASLDELQSAMPEREGGFQIAPAPAQGARARDAIPPEPAGVTAPGGGTPEASKRATTPGAPQGQGEADTGLNCASIYDQVSACYTSYDTCASSCGDESCTQSCEADYMACYGAQVALGSSAAKVAFDALRACEDTHWVPCYEEGGALYDTCAAACADEACTQSCATEANGVLEACMVQSCSNAYQACGVNAHEEEANEPESNTELPGDSGAGPDTTGPGQSVTMTCGELYVCEDQCNGNQSCGQACFDQGDEQAKSQWTQLIQCGMSYCNGQVANAEEYQTCLSQMCPQEYGVCFSSAPDTSGEGSGSSAGTTCGEGYKCIQSCYSTAYDESSFYGCVQGCEGAMSSQGKVLMDSLTSCADVECYDVPGSFANYYTCIEDFCTSEYMACINQPSSTPLPDPGSGSGTGVELTTCLDVHEAVLGVCVPAYSTCMAGCSDQSCADMCSGDISACIQAQQNAAPYEAGQDFSEVLACRQTHFDTCNTEADALLGTCDAACAAGDQACSDACFAQSDVAYEACYDQACASEYATCGITTSGSQGSGAAPSPAPGQSHDSCLDIYKAVKEVCDAGYVNCTQSCADQGCADACADEANTCVDTEIQSASDPNDGADYEAVLSCWNTHYESCYGAGGAVFETCMAECTQGEAACKESCNTPAMETYAGCYSEACADQYATCGIE